MPRGEVAPKDATPVRLALSTPIAEDADKGDALSFQVAADVTADGAVVIAKGAAAKGVIAEASRRKMMLRKGMTMLFDSVLAVDGKQVRLREISQLRPGADRKPREVGRVGKDKQSVVPA